MISYPFPDVVVIGSGVSMEIFAKKALYIKLGEGGSWERECFENGYLKLGYHDVSHEDCSKGNWDRCSEFLINQMGKKPGPATFHGKCLANRIS